MNQTNKIIISSIGTGVRYKTFGKTGDTERHSVDNYETTTYCFADSDAKYETAFVAESIIRHEKPDKLLLVGTAGSCWDALFWYYYESIENCPYDLETAMEYWEYLRGIKSEKGHDSSMEELDKVDFRMLEEVLEQHFQIKVQILLIRYGLNRQETLENFQRLYCLEELLEQEQDNEICMDITHSFRSLPFYQFMLINYLIRLSKSLVRLSNVYYGMLEVNRELGYTPVVDLNVLTELMGWINGISELKSYGSVERISEELHGQDEIRKWLEVFEYATNTNDYHQLDASLNRLKKMDIDGLINMEPHEKKLISHIQTTFEEQFSEEKYLKEAKMQFAMAEWYRRQRRYGSCIVLLQETVRTFLTTVMKQTTIYQHNEKKNITNEAFRKLSIDLIRTFCEREPERYGELLAFYMDGKTMRDSFAHNLIKMEEINTKTSVDDFMEKIKSQKLFLEKYEGYLKKILNNREWHRRFARDIERHVSDAEDLDNSVHATNIEEEVVRIVIFGKEQSEHWTSVEANFPNPELTIQYAPEDICLDYMKSNQSKKEQQQCMDDILKYLEELKEEKKQVIVVLKSTDYIKQTRIIQKLEQKGYDVRFYIRNSNFQVGLKKLKNL